MPDRIVRAGLLESDHWLDLRNAVERLSYVAVLLKADDIGTLDATDGALVRLWSGPCGIRTREEAVKVLEALTAADLVRTYTAGGKRYIFVPRFRQRFRARTLKRPAPPVELLTDEPAVHANINEISARAEKMSDNRPQDAGNGQASAPVVVVEGVGVGEFAGGVEEILPSTPVARTKRAARYRFDPEDRAVAEEILAGARQVIPKGKPPNLDGWANEIRLLREQDGRTHAEIRDLFAWANADPFWRANILCPEKLRVKWDSLTARRGAGSQSKVGPQPYDPLLALRERHGGVDLWAIEHLMRAGFSPRGAEDLVIDAKAAVDRLADPRRTPEALFYALLNRDPRTEKPGAWLIEQVREHADQAFRQPAGATT